jgi:hypothetical protein
MADEPINDSNVTSILLKHEGRISALEKGQEDMLPRMDKLEKKLDKIVVLEYGVLLAIVLTFVATHLHF